MFVAHKYGDDEERYVATQFEDGNAATGIEMHCNGLKGGKQEKMLKNFDEME